MIKIKTALISVFDKTGVLELAEKLVKNNTEILSSGGTAKYLKENNIDGNYEKILTNENEVEQIIKKIKNEEIFGMNVTVPYKQSVIPFLESMSEIKVILVLKFFNNCFTINFRNIIQSINIKPWRFFPVKAISKCIIWRSYIPVAR